MFRSLFILIVLLVSIISPPSKAAESKNEEGRYKIHVITIGQGEELFTRFGHIALMVDDVKKDIRKVYNFGTFNFTDPNLRIKYARGFLNYWLSLTTYSNIVMTYKHYDRDVFVRTLSLTPTQAEEVNRRLEENALPENRVYAYRHYVDNCCTRIRDLLDDVTEGAISNGRNVKPTGRTFRDWTDEVLYNMPFYNTVILYSLGPAIDKPITRWNEEFLPHVLAADLDEVRFGLDNRPLVEKTSHVVKRQGPTIGAKMADLDIYIIALIVLVLLISIVVPVVLGTQKIAARAVGLGLLFWGLIAGLGGLMLLLYFAFTTHYDTHYNENLLVNPFFHLWLIGPGIKLIFKAKLKERTARILGYYLLASIGLIIVDVVLKAGPFIQGNWGVIAVALFCNAAGIFVLRRIGMLPTLQLGKISI